MTISIQKDTLRSQTWGLDELVIAVASDSMQNNRDNCEVASGSWHLNATGSESLWKIYAALA